MQAIHLLKAKKLILFFLKLIKVIFNTEGAGIAVKATAVKESKQEILKMIRKNRQNAPVIAADIDIRGLIDSAQYPDQ